MIGRLRARCNDARCAAVGLVVLSALASSACAVAAVTPTVRTPRASVVMHADVSVIADALDRPGAVRVTYCPAPGTTWTTRRITPENLRALPALISATDDNGAALGVDDSGVHTERLIASQGCAVLVVDIGALADALASKDSALRVGDDLLLSPDVWLWHPASFDDGDALLARVTPGAFFVFAPWPTDPVSQRYRVTASTYRLKCDTAIGTFATTTLEVAGATLDVVQLGEQPAAAEVTAWLLASARAVASLSGRFPVAHLNVIVVPRPSARPVLGGFFSRGGGPTALFFVSSQQTDLSDSDDHDASGRWALTHEFSHAHLPAVQAQDAWFNEGLATWHQDLLARRVGLVASDERFWQGLVDGLKTGAARAAEDGLTVTAAAARMHDTGAYQHAYWAGAAIVLIAEVNARQHGASVDDVVLAIKRRHPSDDRARAALQLLHDAMQERGAVQVAAAAWERAYDDAKDRPFPDAAATLRALGVLSDSDGNVSFDDAAPLAYVRHALTAAAPEMVH